MSGTIECFLVRLSRTLLALLAVATVAALDSLSGSEIAFSLFYLIPIGALAWYGHLPETVALVVAATVGWLVADLGHPYAHPAILYWNSFVRLVIFTFVGGLLLRAHHENGKLAALLSTDPLTGLANRKRLFEVAGAESERARRYGHPLTLAYLDLDDFKQINDCLGHAAGDRVLKQVGDTLRRSLRVVDLAARLGGDEFVLLLPETGPAAARATLEKLRTGFVQGFAPEHPPVGVSIGAITFTRMDLSVQEMLTTADDLMYEVKRRGKNATGYRTC